MDDLITIIINVYNGEKYITKCIESALNQTYKNIEILIVNDGSTDRTLEICESYKDSRIRIINQENMGLALSRNVGIENSKGEYLYFIDSDDYIENDTIEYLYNLLKIHNTKIATCRPIDVYDYETKAKNPKEVVQVISGLDMLKKVLLSEDRAGTTWNKLVKKELFDNLKFEKRIINDVVNTYKLVLSTDRIVYSNQIKYYYLKHSDSILGRKSVEHSIDLYKASLERYDFIKKLYPDLIENNICVITVIMILFLNEKEELQEYLKNENALKKSKEMFTMKIISCKMRLKEKLKIVLFRISPYLYRSIVKFYISIKFRNKGK